MAIINRQHQPTTITVTITTNHHHIITCQYHITNTRPTHDPRRHGAVRVTEWAVAEPSLAPLLFARDRLGLTPLALASKALANLLRPLFKPHPSSLRLQQQQQQHNSRSSTSLLLEPPPIAVSSPASVLEMAGRLLAVVNILRGAQHESTKRQQQQQQQQQPTTATSALTSAAAAKRSTAEMVMGDATAHRDTRAALTGLALFIA
jgi:hypothetical protein